MNTVIPSADRSVTVCRQSGFSLIELMVAITISLIILAALTVMFVTSSRAREEITRANQQIENGRYAMQVLADDLRLAGYYGGFDPRPDNPDSIFATDPPNPCITTLAALKANLILHVQGYDEGAGITTECNAALTNRKAGTDVVVIRRVSTCKAGPITDTDCSSLAGHYYFQASHCSTQLNAASAVDPYAADTNAYILAVGATNAAFNRTRKECDLADPADIRRLITHIYYIDEGSYTDADGRDIPTLVRAELKGANFNTRTPLAEGIEQMELQYRNVDNDYIDPDTAIAADWRSVTAAELYLLARSTDPSPGHTDTKTYTLGTDTFTPGDTYKRHVFQTNVLLSNPAGLY